MVIEHATQPSPRARDGPCRALGVPERYADYHVYVDTPSGGGMIVHTPSTRAVSTALAALHAAGGNPLIYGPRGCGKSLAVRRLLQARALNVPTSPAEVRLVKPVCSPYLGPYPGPYLGPYPGLYLGPYLAPYLGRYLSAIHAPSRLPL